MRSGCSLTATVLLLLFAGLTIWGLRHWQPDLICRNAGNSWLCGSTANWASTIKDTVGYSTRERTDVAAVDQRAGREYEQDEPATEAATESGAAQALPWPVAEKSRIWTNFRDGAYSVPSVADVKEAAPKAALATGVAHPFPWPVAEKSISWSNFREGAYSIAAAPEAAGSDSDVSGKTVPHPFPWPVADAPVEWTNVRKPSQPKKIVAKKKQSKTVAHPFPWPVADEPVKWTNVRKNPEPSEPESKTVAHPFPWPVADKPVKWTNVRKQPAPAAAAPASPSVPYGDGFVAHNPRPPRNALELLVLRVDKDAVEAEKRAREARRQARNCSNELNRVARSGDILFETNSARLTQSSYATLDRLADVALTCRQLSITVEGHTDDSGPAAYNQTLSERRAQSVAAYLQGAGVSTGSLRAVGFGESRPAVPNTSAGNMAKNRRIEFSVSGS